jgi:hypothetical protein
MRSFWMTAFALLCLSLAACGGGGGGGGSSTPDGAFTLSGNSATFAALQGSTVPPSSTLTMNITGKNVAYVGAAYTNGQAQPNWLNINVVGSGSTYSVLVGVRQTNIQPGQYSSTFSVGTANSNGDVLQSQAITVSYTVTARVAITGTTNQLTFTYGGAETTQSVALSVQAANRTWTAASNAPWLTVPTASQTGNGTLNATLDVSTLEPGTYSGQVTITDTANAQNTSNVTVTTTVLAPTLTVGATDFTLGGDDGLSATTLPLTFSLSSGTTNHTFANHTFTITPTTDSGGDWLRPSVTAGAIGATGATLDINAVRGSLVGATYTGQLSLNVTVKNVVLSQLLPVTYNIEASRIVVGAAGVGLSSSPAPARSVLTRAVPVFSSIGRNDVPWQASSDQSWLDVTASGSTGQSITLTADPSGLAADQTHFATVTVTSTDPLVENDETIRVGLHINSAEPTTVVSAITAQYVVTSPTEPVVFLNNGGATVTGYDVYTGATVRTFTGNVADAGQMTMSGDGQRLYVYDSTNIRVVELNAVTGALIRQYSATTTYGTPNGRGMTFFRPAGYSILVLPSGRMVDVDTQAEYQPENFTAPMNAMSFTSSIDSTMLVGHAGTIYRARRTALAGGSISATYLMNPGTAQGRDGQACISSDLQTVYTASGAPYNFPGTNIETGQRTQTLPGSNYPNSMLCLWNGVVVGGINGYYNNVDVWVYDGPSGQELAQLSSAAATSYRDLLHRGMAASADATRLITLSQSTYNPDRGLEVKIQSIPGAL